MLDPSRIVPLVIVAILAFAYGSYIQGVLKGRIRPSQTTWLIYTCSNVIALAAALQLREGAQLLLISIFTLGASSILIISLIKKVRQPVTALDWLCGCLAIVALFLKFQVGNQAALACVVCVWLCAWVPQVRSCWRKGEDWRPSILFSVAALLSLWLAHTRNESPLVAGASLFQSGVCLLISLFRRPQPWLTSPTP